MNDLFSKTMFRYSLIIILSSAIWLRPSAIGWHDTPLNQFFTYEVVDEQNKTYAFPKNNFDPYDAFFQTDMFYYLIKHKLTGISGFGYTGHYRLAKKLKQVKFNELKKLENVYGKVKYNVKKRSGFIKFIRLFFKNKNERINKHLFFTRFHAPYHLNNGVYGNVFPGKTRVKKVMVYFNQTLRNGSKILQLKKEICLAVDIPF